MRIGRQEQSQLRGTGGRFGTRHNPFARTARRTSGTINVTRTHIPPETNVAPRSIHVTRRRGNPNRRAKVAFARSILEGVLVYWLRPRILSRSLRSLRLEILPIPFTLSVLRSFRTKEDQTHLVHTAKTKNPQNANKTVHFSPKTNLVARCASYANKMCTNLISLRNIPNSKP